MKEKIKESLSSVLPIALIVLLLSVSIVPVSAGVMVLFLFGVLLLIFGMGLFTLGAEMSMLPMGEGIGVEMSKSKKITLPLIVCLILGLLITVAEPDLQVLANQIPSISSITLILTVAVGVGLFLVVAMLRILLKIKLNYLLFLFYAMVFVLSFFAPKNFIPAAFDAGGVTTGPMTVPFIMAFGIGMASIRSDKKAEADSFGLVALSSIGPILSVLILGLCYKPEAQTSVREVADISTTAEALLQFTGALPEYAKDVLRALLPIAAVFLIFQLVFRRFHRIQLIRIISGFLYTYSGLVLFLTGVNVGFMPAGSLIGSELVAGELRYLLVPVGMLVGYFIVSAEPAVLVLKKQVEEISNGSISQSAIGLALSIGVAISVGLSMLRLLTGISVFWFLIPGYIISLALSFFVPPIYTAIAFDSGGVASGPMTATFLLPLTMGACVALGGNLMTDAFGIIAMVAMTPLITIQLLGLYTERKRKAERRRLEHHLSGVEDRIIYFDV